MRDERLTAMRERGISYDLETWLITMGNSAPPVVCGSIGWLDVVAYDMLLAARDATIRGQAGEAEALIARVRERLAGSANPARGAFLTREQAAEIFLEILRDKTRVIIGAHLQFDLLAIAVHLAKQGVDVLPLIYEALADDRCYDIQFAEALHAIAGGHLNKDPRTGTDLRNPETGKRGSYSLATVVDLVLGRTDAKMNDEWRLRYAELDGVPYEEWPAPARDYPIDDARNTVEAALAQCGHLPKREIHHRFPPAAVIGDGELTACLDCGATSLSSPCLVTRRHRNLHDLGRQVRAAWAMYIGAAWGFATDQTTVDLIVRAAERTAAAGIKPFIEAGFIRANGTGNQSALKRSIAQAYGAIHPCAVCAGTGKRPSPKNPKSKINCYVFAEDGETKVKTCDGTGYDLPVNVPRAEKGGVSTSGDTLSESGDDLLMMLGDYKDDQKILSVYAPFLRRGRAPVAGHAAECPTRSQAEGKKKNCNCPGPYRAVPLTLSPNPVLETGRAAYRGAVQQFPRWPGFWTTFEDLVEVADDYILQEGERLATPADLAPKITLADDEDEATC